MGISFKALEENSGCNFDSFMKASSPTKRMNKSKSVTNRQDWNTLTLAQQYEILHNLSYEHTSVTLNFEALSLALKTAQSSFALKKTFKLEEGSGPSADQDELNFLKELLEEQCERSEAIIQLEDQRLNLEMELMELKCQLAKESDTMRKSYAKLMQMDPEDNVGPAYKRKALDQQAVGSILEEKRETLKAEEDRVTQFKYAFFLLQKSWFLKNNVDMFQFSVHCCHVT